MSKKKGFPAEVVTTIVHRDNGKCARCGKHVTHLQRGFSWSVHHRRPRSRGGTSLVWVDLAANGVVLCGSGTTGCHGWVESNRAEAVAAGFIVSALGVRTAADIPIRHHEYGLCYLNDYGGVDRIEEGWTPEAIEAWT